MNDLTPAGPDDSATKSIFTVNALVAGYRRGLDIVRSANLEVREGQVVCIVGPNGAGKSTLLKAIFGLVPVRSGTVSCFGQTVTGRPPHQMVTLGVGYVPQVNEVFSSLTITENLRMGGRPLARQAVRDRAEELFGWFPELAERRHVRAGSLSGGQRRLVSLARALMPAPRLLLLDEPSAGLSPANVHAIFKRIGEIRDRGVAIAMVEQNAHEGLALADVGYVLDQGRERITAPGPQLLNDPRVRDLYLGTA